MHRIQEHADVVVVGGGTAGAIAALQSARSGASTAVVEMHGRLGGTTTIGGINFPQFFSAGDRQVIAGIGFELVKQTLELERRELPDFQKPHATRPGRGVMVNRFLYSCVLEEACLRAGVRLHFHEITVGAESTAGGWQIRTVGKGVNRTITAKELIDCTGDAVVVGMLGFELEQSAQRQPGTLVFTLGGYDPDSLDADEVERRYQQALKSGKLVPGDFWLSDKPFMAFLRSRGRNNQHVPDADSTTSETQAQANIAGRESLMRLYRFVQSLPGCEHAFLQDMCDFTAVRETSRIIGETRVTYEDYISGRVFPDAIGYSFFYIDIHTSPAGVEHEYLRDGVLPTIPLGALIPRGSRRLLTAGRTISSDRKAHSALRVQPSCMVMGQAAGAAAALGVRHQVPSREVPIDEIRALLAQQGAILPPLPAA
jgi:hypothetical protein